MKRLFNIVLPVIGRQGVLKYALLGILSGLCNFLFINSVTRIVGLIASGRYTAISREYIIIFISIILVFIWLRRTLSLLMMKVSQKISWTLRKQVLELTLNANYQQFTGRKHRIGAALLSDVNVLTGASMSSIDFSVSSIIVISCFVYMASISLVLFFISLGVAALGVAIYLVRGRANMQNFQKARALENKFQENFNSILNGFKEIYMEPEKGRYIVDEKMSGIANNSYRINVITMTGILNSSVIGQVLFYILISMVLLVFTVALGIQPAGAVSFAFTLMYLLGSVESLMTLLPALMRAGVACDNLVALRTELEEVTAHNHFRDFDFSRSFTGITVRDIEFSYSSADTAFHIGPVNMDIEKGEAIFIYGGNGSGKTTLINCILGLYQPSKGKIRIGDIPVNENNYAGYRKLFAPVFSDFYLFNDIAGTEPDQEKWKYYLHLFELEGKVTLQKNNLSTIDLSTGQKKRLALILSLMENKPVLVLDEWAADQDPYFRKKFYTEIIPLLKKENITVIAITHDDKYYYVADKLFKMEEGKLIEEKTLRHADLAFTEKAIL